MALSVSDKYQDGAYADVTVKIGVIKLLQKEFDLCEEACVAIAYLFSFTVTHQF